MSNQATDSEMECTIACFAGLKNHKLHHSTILFIWLPYPLHILLRWPWSSPTSILKLSSILRPPPRAPILSPTNPESGGRDPSPFQHVKGHARQTIPHHSNSILQSPPLQSCPSSLPPFWPFPLCLLATIPASSMVEDGGWRGLE